MAQLIRLAAHNPVLISRSLLRAVPATQAVEPKRNLFFGFGKIRKVDGKDVDSSEIRLAEPVEHATGLEKMLLLAAEKGIDDPFSMKPQKRGPGTKDNPNLIPTFEEKRLMGCICEEDQTYVNYMWIHLGDPKRCECGHWFKAVPARKFWEEVDYKPGS